MPAVKLVESSVFPDYKRAAVDSLIPYARNSRTHSDEQVGQIAASIKEFGFLNPIIVDGESGIIAGHGRVLAAQKLGMTDVPVIEASYLTDHQRKAYIIADNKLAMNAGWDDEMLRVEFDELGEAGFDLELTGFSLDEIGELSFDNDSETGMPALADGDGEPFQKKTFILHDEQTEIVEDAVTLARTNPLSDTGINDNSNGNAIALICLEWLEAKNDER